MNGKIALGCIMRDEYSTFNGNRVGHQAKGSVRQAEGNDIRS